MEVQRRHRTKVQIQDQENVYVGKGKINLPIPSKRQGLTVRGALGDVNSNIPLQRDISNGKVAITTAEFEKKVALTRGAIKSNYSHVQSKIDTGLAVKTIIQPISRPPPLRREESTGVLAARAVVTTQAVLKDVTNKQNDLKETGGILKARKCKVDIKKSSKLPTLKEAPKETKTVLKPILKESTESLNREKAAKTKEVVKESSEKCVVTVSKPQIPDDIEDIDANDMNSPLLMSIYIKDIYNYLIELEEKYPIKVDFLKTQTEITGAMRATLMDWLVEIHTNFALLLDTFHLTVGIIDRYLQEVRHLPKEKFQLVGVTAMFIASKYEEIYAPEARDFLYITENSYDQAQLFQCERDIMTKLGFCLARPIPLSFLRRFVKAAHGTSKNHHLAKYFVDLALIEYSMAHYRPSELAASAVCLSLYLLSNKSLSEVWTPTLSYYSGYKFDHIEPIIKKLAKIVVNVEKSKYKSVYSKYLHPTLAKVSSLPQLKSEAIHELAKPST